MLTGVILAGGQNRRMNGNIKAFLSFRGETMIGRQIAEMAALCDDIVVVANEQGRFSSVIDAKVRLVGDIIPGQGPLGGMQAGLSAAKHSEAWIVACDMPFISSSAARLMWDMLETHSCMAVVPVLSGRMHPLHGVYHKDCVVDISNVLSTDKKSVKAMLDRIEWVPANEELFTLHGIPLNFSVNVNTPEEYQGFCRLM